MIQNDKTSQFSPSQKVLGQVYAQLIRLARQKKLEASGSSVIIKDEQVKPMKDQIPGPAPPLEFSAISNPQNQQCSDQRSFEKVDPTTPTVIKDQLHTAHLPTRKK